MMIRQLSSLLLVGISAALLQIASSIEPIIGSELVLRATAVQSKPVTCLLSAVEIDRILVLSGIDGRAYNVDLEGGRSFRLPINRLCTKRCDQDEPINCQMSSIFTNIDTRPETAAKRGRAGASAPDFDASETIRTVDGTIVGRFAAGCISGGQSWVSLVNHKLSEEICHTNPSLAHGEKVMLTASDSLHGHYYFYKADTQEVCQIKDYHLCQQGHLCPPPKCRRMHSPVTALAGFGILDSNKPCVIVGCQNGETIMLVDMKPISFYKPYCYCQDCIPVPMSIATCSLTRRVYILYSRCNRGNFVSVVTDWYYGRYETSSESYCVPTPVELATIRAPSILQIAISPATGVLFATGYRGENKYFVYAIAVIRGAEELFKDYAAAKADPVPEWAIISSALLRGCPTAQHVSPLGDLYIAIDRSIVHDLRGIRIVPIEFYARINVNGRVFEMNLDGIEHAVDMYRLEPSGEPIPEDKGAKKSKKEL